MILPRNTLQHEFNSPGSLRGLCPVVVEMLMEDDFFFFACLSGSCINKYSLAK